MKFGQVEREEGLESHKSVKKTYTNNGWNHFVIAAILGAFIVNFNLLDPELIRATFSLVFYV